jgi:GT2 family glycosyltransferase
LEIALRSVSEQAERHDAELVVVEDESPDPETEGLAWRYGARYFALGAPRGLNIARNTAIEHATTDLLCLLDDDVEVWDGWLDALLAAAAALPECEVFGGPIRARLEGGNLHACGREPLPLTHLDLGAADRDAEFVWGANLTLRRSALERIGPFDPALSGAGDEEEWQRRLRAAGGRIRYVAAAGVDHRRAGADARLTALARANYARGRQARHWDARKGTAPPLPGELRTLAGCGWHTVRYRCGNGIVLAALTAGRLREALAPAGVPPAAPAGPVPAAPAGAPPAASGVGPAPAGGPDYLSGASGTLSRRGALLGAARDAVADVRAAPRRLALASRAAAAPRRRVLVLGVARPGHERATARVRRELARSRHDIEVHLLAPDPGAGKWENLNRALAAHPPAGRDWLLLVDDDVALPRGFLDAFLLCAERFGFRLAQPAHTHASHAAWEVTRRQGALARRTRFVEIGPVTALHADTFAALLPFPDLRMGWGLDAHWAALAAEHGWPVGVVDATPVRHLRPVAAAYPRADAIAEAEAFLDGRAYLGRDAAGETVEAYRAW